MNPSETSILQISNIFGKAVLEVIKKFCHLEVIVGKNAQFLSTIQISEDIGAFVSFNGNYSGLMVMNFEGNAALELVDSSMRAVGMPEDEIPSHYMADDVRSSIGELVNHIIGNARAKVQEEYDLSAKSTIPAVLPIATPIGLFFKSSISEGHACVRLVFRTPENHRFHLELTMESSQIVELPS
jgi:CheY-specific phosphatase CheX